MPAFEQIEYDPRHCLHRVLHETCFRRHGVGCCKNLGFTKATEGRASASTAKICQNAVTSVSSLWQSKTTVLMMNWCTCKYNNANEFLKISTITCMSMRPWAEIRLTMLMSATSVCRVRRSQCRQTTPEDSPNSTPLAHHLVPGYRTTIQIAAGTSASTGSAAPCQKPCDGHTLRSGTKPRWKKKAHSLKTWPGAFAVLQRKGILNDHCNTLSSR